MTEIKEEKTDFFYAVVAIIFAASIAISAPYMIANQRIDLTNLAKGDQNASRGEVFEDN